MTITLTPPPPLPPREVVWDIHYKYYFQDKSRNKLRHLFLSLEEGFRQLCNDCRFQMLTKPLFAIGQVSLKLSVQPTWTAMYNEGTKMVLLQQLIKCIKNLVYLYCSLKIFFCN